MNVKKLEKLEFICKGCPACHYCDSDACKTWHCGFSTLMGFESFKSKCFDNKCIIKKMVPFLQKVSNDPKYAMQALPLLYALDVNFEETKLNLWDILWKKLKKIY